jgi:uncharacterized membrane protein
VRERPRLRVLYATGAFVILILMWAYVIARYPGLPEIFPTHFDSSGHPDRFGTKGVLWVLPVIATLMFAALVAAQRLDPGRSGTHLALSNVAMTAAAAGFEIITIVSPRTTEVGAELPLGLTMSGLAAALAWGLWFRMRSSSRSSR